MEGKLMKRIDVTLDDGESWRFNHVIQETIRVKDRFLRFDQEENGKICRVHINLSKVAVTEEYIEE